jgi:hypothetical protein
MLRMRIEGKGPVAAFRWRGVPGKDAALADLAGASRPDVALFGGTT